MRGLCLLLLLSACASRRDRDVDGLPDHRDRCPREAEVENGWADDDGCPDALARLRVRVTSAGSPVEGALVSLPGAPPIRTGADGIAVFLELVPLLAGVIVDVQHPILGPGEAMVPLPEGATEVSVDLEPAQ
jgi:hypothetical protein